MSGLKSLLESIERMPDFADEREQYRQAKTRARQQTRYISRGEDGLTDREREKYELRRLNTLRKRVKKETLPPWTDEDEVRESVNYRYYKEGWSRMPRIPNLIVFRKWGLVAHNYDSVEREGTEARNLSHTNKSITLTLRGEMDRPIRNELDMLDVIIWDTVNNCDLGIVKRKFVWIVIDTWFPHMTKYKQIYYKDQDQGNIAPDNITWLSPQDWEDYKKLTDKYGEEEVK